MRFRATNYLSQPHWAVAVNWNRFPVAPLMDLATHMGAQFPPKLKLSGTIDGAIGYSGQGSLQGQLAFHDAARHHSRFAAGPFRAGARDAWTTATSRLSPALVHTADQDEAQHRSRLRHGPGRRSISRSPPRP